jgi:hypothetical protein
MRGRPSTSSASAINDFPRPATDRRRRDRRRRDRRHAIAAVETAGRDAVPGKETGVDKLQLILYGGASLLALRSLVSLMSDHRRRYAAKATAGQARQAPAAAPAKMDRPGPPRPGGPAERTFH